MKNLFFLLLKIRKKAVLPVLSVLAVTVFPLSGFAQNSNVNPSNSSGTIVHGTINPAGDVINDNSNKNTVAIDTTSADRTFINTTVTNVQSVIVNSQEAVAVPMKKVVIINDTMQVEDNNDINQPLNIPPKDVNQNNETEEVKPNN